MGRYLGICCVICNLSDECFRYKFFPSIWFKPARSSRSNIIKRNFKHCRFVDLIVAKAVFLLYCDCICTICMPQGITHIHVKF
uniref:Secreted protein n=1 Tax=Mesocestoides corti TaxID=53468 RepID=A0A5K3FQ92_MESCO